MADINKIRAKIDAIDQKIGELLEEREKEITNLRRIKNEQNLPVRDQNREKEIIGKFKNPYQKAIFKKILAESRKIQR